MDSSKGGLQEAPRNFFLVLWDDGAKDVLKDTSGLMLMAVFSISDCLDIYLQAEKEALSRGGETWSGIRDMLSSPEGHRRCTLIDILFAMAFSPNDPLAEGKRARELWEGVLDNFSSLLLLEIESWLRSGEQARRPPFDIKALFEIAVNIKGREDARELFPLSPKLVEKGILLPLNPIRRFLPPSTAGRDDLFGEVLPSSLGIIPEQRELWFEMDRGAEIWTVKPWSEKHPRSLRREFFKSPVPWSLPLSDNNLTKLFLHRACPSAPPPHTSSSHPGGAEYFIFMPEGMETDFPYEFFLDRNMIPVFAKNGLEYLTDERPPAPGCKEPSAAEKYLRFMANRDEEESDPSLRLWRGAGMAIFLNLFLAGFVHPALDVAPPSSVPAEVTLERLVKLPEQRDEAIEYLVKATAKLRWGDRGDGTGGMVLSFPWDKNIALRPLYALSELSERFPAPQWWISAEKHFGETASLQKWSYATHTSEGVLHEPAPGVESVFASMRGNAVREAVKTLGETQGQAGREGGGEGGGSAFLMSSRPWNDMGGP